MEVMKTLYEQEHRLKDSRDREDSEAWKKQGWPKLHDKWQRPLLKAAQASEHDEISGWYEQRTMRIRMGKDNRYRCK